MLRRLALRDFVIVPSLELDFHAGFSVLTGETGAGKAILVDALQLALGDSNWRKFFLEGQLFVAAIYFVFCFAMSRYSRWVEGHLNTGTRRQ